MRDLVRARLVALAPTMQTGVAHLAIVVELITVGARLEASRAGRGEVASPDLDRAQHHALQLLRFGDVKARLLVTPEVEALYRTLPVQPKRFWSR